MYNCIYTQDCLFHNSCQIFQGIVAGYKIIQNKVFNYPQYLFDLQRCHLVCMFKQLFLKISLKKNFDIFHDTVRYQGKCNKKFKAFHLLFFNGGHITVFYTIFLKFLKITPIRPYTFLDLRYCPQE